MTASIQFDYQSIRVGSETREAPFTHQVITGFVIHGNHVDTYGIWEATPWTTEETRKWMRQNRMWKYLRYNWLRRRFKLFNPGYPYTALVTDNQF